MSTTPPNTSDDEPLPGERPQIDAAVADFVDRGIPIDEASLDHAGRLRAADGLLVHSLLEQSLRTDVVARERRIVRVCAAVEKLAAEVAVPPPVIPRRRRWLTPLVVAASLVIAAAFLRVPFNPSRQTALAAVTATLKAAEAGTDRKYLVTTELRTAAGEDKSIQADLWVHGNSRYVLRQDGALGDFLMGSDGVEYWVTPSIGPIFVGKTPGLLEQLVLGDARLATPFLQLTSILDRMAQRYELSLLPEEDLPAAEGSAKIRCTHVLARRRGDVDPLNPETIELWTARQSGIAQRMILSWPLADDDSGLRAVTLNLRPVESSISEEWYGHRAHHAPDRDIIERTPEAQP